MTVKRSIAIIKQMVKLLYLYFGGIKMEAKNKMQVPSFLQKVSDKNITMDVSVMHPNIDISDTEEFGDDRDILKNIGSENAKKVCVMKEDSKEVSPMEREAIIQSVRGMNKEQLEIMLDNVPIEMVYNRLGRELERNKAFINSMKNAMSLITKEPADN